MPTAATSGITMGAITALAPAKVPSRVTSTTEQTMVAIIARFWVRTPIFRISTLTMAAATPVFLSTMPSPEPSMMMNPTRARKGAHGLVDHRAQAVQGLFHHDCAHNSADGHVHQRMHPFFKCQDDVQQQRKQTADRGKVEDHGSFSFLDSHSCFYRHRQTRYAGTGMGSSLTFSWQHFNIHLLGPASAWSVSQAYF